MNTPTRDPLERFEHSYHRLLIRIGIVGLCALGMLVATACGGKQAAPAATEVASAAVHPCDSNAPDPFGVQASRLGGAAASGTQAPVSTAVPTVADGSGFGTGLAGCDGPDFSQRCPVWGSLEYDHGGGADIGCGRTIAQCGCAMTSAASLLLRYGVTRGPDGTPTTPKSLNDWFNQNSRQTAQGFVSQGYVYGAVNWLAVATYSKLAAAKFGTPSLTYGGSLPGDLTSLKRELDNSRPVILEQPRHFVLATGESSSDVTISDPFYPDRKLLDTPAYHDSFVSGRLYRPGSDLSAIMLAMPKSGARVSITDPTGARTGYAPGQQTTVTQVKQSQFAIEDAWQDPTCTASSPRAEFGVAEATLLQPAGAHYGIDVEGDPNGRFNFAVYAYDQAGALVLQNFEGALPASGAMHYDLDYNPAPGSKQPITQQAAPTPPPANPTSRPVSGATSAPAAASATPAPTTTAATATRTPTPKPKATATRTPTATATTTPAPAASIKMTVAPDSLQCDAQAFVIVTITLLDVSGKAPQPASVTVTTKRGTVTPPSVSFGNGVSTMSVRVYPGINPDSNDVTIFVLGGVVGNPQFGTAVSFVCKTPPPVIL
ncbi:MAG TPA: C39 family peptidase [Dehalococcoidia bacterium]